MIEKRVKSLDIETMIAFVLTWAIGFASGVACGLSVNFSSGWSAVVLVCIGIGYLADAGMRDAVDSPLGAVCFAVIGYVLALVFFAGDCLVGSIRAPDVPLLTACVQHSGAGFAITLLSLASTTCLATVCLIRSALLIVLKRGR